MRLKGYHWAPRFGYKGGILLLSLALLFVVASLATRSWITYVGHLIDHQLYIWNNLERLDKLTRSLTPQQSQKVELIGRAKAFGLRAYQLNKSESFEKIVFLPRDTLGWNLTVAYPLLWKTRTFWAPGLGKFGYIGFFNRDLAQKWKEAFEEEGFDVYMSPIGGYSTLGILNDPLFSTYLKFSDYSLASMILHEMAHERLYFKSDSHFSESLASFIDVKAAEVFYKEELKRAGDPHAKEKIKEEYNKFYTQLEGYRRKLTTLYDSELPDDEKRRQKSALMVELKADMEKLSKGFTYVGGPKRLAAMEEINNAALLQFHRYNPPMRGGFEALFEECHEDFNCWFDNLALLKSCAPQERRRFIEEFSGDAPFLSFAESCAKEGR